MNLRRFFSWTFFITGFLFLLFVIVYPLTLWYYSWLIRPPSMFDPGKTAPYPIPKFLNSQGFYQDVVMADPSNWFPLPSQASVSASPVSSFLLSIPTLKLTDILVKVNGQDLKKNPIHYPGTALPGQIGNSVILGHSALPHLYFFKSPLAIFNPILKLKLGDQVITNYNGINYTYQINQIFEVSPDRIDVLNQPTDRRQLTLITCVPLGTYLRRLVVVGDLVN